MDPWVRFVGPTRALEVFGVKLVGLNADNGKKLLLSIALVLLVLAVSRALRWVAARAFVGRHDRIRFWVRQSIRVTLVSVALVGLVSIWFDEPTRLATAMGLVTAGLAFALQRVVTAVAGYVVILRGKTFNVGDRITMGGVRGDVIALGFIQTTIMEMGQPPPVQNADPAMWVRSRQYTGRIVTVTNDKVFEEPVYNFTRDFPYIWEEVSVPVGYKADRARAESILLDAAKRQTVKIAELSDEDARELERRYVVKRSGLDPKVYWRLTDNWLELSVRFITTTHGVRDLKDAMSREILEAFDAAGIDIASATFEIVGLPPLSLKVNNGDGAAASVTRKGEGVA